MNTDIPTPRTDAFYTKHLSMRRTEEESIAHAEMLERELAQAVEERDALRSDKRALEIMHRVEFADREKAEKERDQLLEFNAGLHQNLREASAENDTLEKDLEATNELLAQIPKGAMETLKKWHEIKKERDKWRECAIAIKNAWEARSKWRDEHVPREIELELCEAVAAFDKLNSQLTDKL